MDQNNNAQGQAVDDILSNDLSGVDTRNPILPKARYRFKVAKVEVKTNDENKKSVGIQLKLNQDATSTDGQALNAGTTFFDNISITPTEKWSRDSIQKALKKFQEGVGVSGPFYPVEQYEGRDIEADVTIQEAKGDYAERNRFRYVNKATGKSN